jgi:hypothetical protein
MGTIIRGMLLLLLVGCISSDAQILTPFVECSTLSSNKKNDNYIDDSLVDSPSCPNAFSTCGSGDYCANAQDGVRLSNTTTGTEAGIAYIENPIGLNPLDGQIAFCGNFTNATYNGGLRLKSIAGDPLIYIKVDTEPFRHLDGRYAMKADTSGAWVYQRFNAFDTYANYKSRTVNTADKQFSLNGQQCLWIMPENVRIAKVVLVNSPSDDLEAIGEGGGTSADIEILELGTETAPTIGTNCTDAAWDGGTSIPLSGGVDANWNNSNESITLIWANNRAACNGFGDCLFVRIKQTDSEDIDTCTANDDSSCLSQDGGEFIVSKGLSVTKHTDTIKEIVTTSGKYRDGNYPSNVYTNSNSFIESIASTDITGGKCIEARVTLPSLTANELGLFNARVNDKDTSGFFRKIHKGSVTEINDLSKASIVKFSSTTILASPGDTTAPTISSCSASCAQTSCTVTCNVSEVSDAWGIYGTSSGSLNSTTTESPSFNASGQEKVQVTFSALNPNTTYFYKIKARDKSPNLNVGETSEASFQTQASSELWIKPTGQGGSDSNDCSSRANACATWSRIKSLTASGKTIIMATGLGNYTKANGQNISIDCNAGWPRGTQQNPITVKMETERGALIISDGLAAPVSIRNCSWYKIEGIAAINATNSSNTNNANGHVFATINSSNIVFYRNLGAYPNRQNNAHVFSIDGNNLTYIENEAYHYHRHGFSSHGSFVRWIRNYANSRDTQDDLAGGFATHRNGGDEGIAVYDCDDCVAVNNIVETSELFGVWAKRAKILGNIALNNQNGFAIQHHCCVSSITTIDFIGENNVAFKNRSNGWMERSVESVISNRNISSIANTNDGFQASNKYSSQNSSASWTINPQLIWVNTLSLGNGQRGYFIDHHTQFSSREVDYPNASGNGGTAYVAPGLDIKTNATTTNPDGVDIASSMYNTRAAGQGCVVYIPTGNELKGVGRGNNDIGANIIYRYDENGNLTNTKLWNQATGEFPCGAAVNFSAQGLVTNDPDGATKTTQACINVHKRLNVGVNGCAIP